MEGKQSVQEEPAFNGQESLPGERREVVLLCGSAEFCAEARRELQRRRQCLKIVATEGMEAAGNLLAAQPPAVILAEGRALAASALAQRERRKALAASLVLLASHAPVVWIGGAEEGSELAPGLAAARVDFVPRSALCLPSAVTLLERRLRVTRASLRERESRLTAVASAGPGFEERDFGEILRHELNNPLTGILGNAELLLLEVRRGNLPLPAPSQQRLETITTLAVRMRETVRQLSDRWEAAGVHPAESRARIKDRPDTPAGG